MNQILWAIQALRGSLKGAATARNDRRWLPLALFFPLGRRLRPRRWFANCLFLLSAGSTEEASDSSKLPARRCRVRTCGAALPACGRLLRRRVISSRVGLEYRECDASPRRLADPAATASVRCREPVTDRRPRGALWQTS